MSTKKYPIPLGQNVLYIYGMKNAEEYEYEFVMVVDKLVEKSTLTHSKFGRLVFGETSGARIWRATKEKERKRSLALGEAMKMAEALGMEFPNLVWEIHQEIRNKGKTT